MDIENVLIGAGTLKIDGDNIGYTEDGVTISLEREYFDVEADQSINILKKKKIHEICNVVTNVLEATLENLKIVFGIGNSVESGEGIKMLSFGGDTTVTEHTLEFNGKAPGGYDRKFFCFKAVSIEAGEHAYKKDDKVIIPVTFQLVADTAKPEGVQYGYFEDTTE